MERRWNILTGTSLIESKPAEPYTWQKDTRIERKDNVRLKQSNDPHSTLLLHAQPLNKRTLN